MIYHSDKCIQVRQYTLDDLCKELKVSKIDLVKINAEGAELDILRGAQEILSHVRALIVAVHHEPNEPIIVDEFLKSKGFFSKIVCIKGNKLVIAFNNLMKAQTL